MIDDKSIIFIKMFELVRDKAKISLDILDKRFCLCKFNIARILFFVMFKHDFDYLILVTIYH